MINKEEFTKIFINLMNTGEGVFVLRSLSSFFFFTWKTCFAKTKIYCVEFKDESF